MLSRELRRLAFHVLPLLGALCLLAWALRPGPSEASRIRGHSSLPGARWGGMVASTSMEADGGDAAVADSGPDSGPDSGINIFESYTWDYSWSGHQAATTQWISSSPDGGVTLAAVDASVPASIDQATTGLTVSGGIGEHRENKAVTYGAAMAGFVNANSLTWSNGDDWHARFLVDTTGIASGTYLLECVNGGTDLIRLSTTGTATKYVSVTVRDDTDGTQFAKTSAILGAASGWQLIDISYCHDCGAGGFSEAKVYVNGDDLSPTVHTAAISFSGACGLATYGLGVGSARGGTAAYAGDGRLLFAGVRWGAAISLAAHQADAVSVGL